MKIFNKDKTHFMQYSPNKLSLIKYDTIKSVTLIIDNILDEGNQQMGKRQVFIAFKKEVT